MGFRQGAVAQRWLRMLPLALALVLGGCGDAPPANQPIAAAQPLAEEVPRIGGETPASRRAVGAEYIGSTACAECHQAEYQAWLGSHHQRAMQAPTAASIAADFQGATAFCRNTPDACIHVNTNSAIRFGTRSPTKPPTIWNTIETTV